jgi:hypothetical protein
MTKTTAQLRDAQIAALLRKFGYRLAGRDIIASGIRGFTADRCWGRCRNAMDAAEQLIPIIADEKFSGRYREITKPTA